MTSVAEMRRTTPSRTSGTRPAPQGSGQVGAADAETFIRAVYERHGTLLLRYAARLLGGDWHRAEDVLQEAAIRAWRHAERLGAEVGEMRPWLFTVVRNLVIDDHRARTLRPADPDPLDTTDIPVADGVDRLLTSQVVLEALGDLTGQQREILRHVYFEGSGVARVAEVLGIPEGTVKSRTYYAVRAMRRALLARGVDG
ncbi:sigma-70 family RNA polymerase sigma factor [Streptomyces capparidis]